MKVIRRRKLKTDHYKDLHVQIKIETYLALLQFAEDKGLGWAIDHLVGELTRTTNNETIDSDDAVAHK